MHIAALTEQVSETLARAIIDKEDAGFQFDSLARKILLSPEADALFGGIFNTNSHKKELSLNAQLAESFAAAANLYANPDYARLSLQTLGYLLTHHRLDNDHYASSTEYRNPIISVEALKSNLDSAQWTALQCYFNLPNEGELDWTKLAVINERKVIHELTELHPKQVPLALDGALQILQFQLPAPQANSEQDTKASLALCRALFVAGIYLNQQEKVELADRLLKSMLESYHSDDDELWLAVLLLSIRDHWSESNFNLAKQVTNNLCRRSLDYSSLTLFNIQLMQHLSSIRDPAESFSALTITDRLAAQYHGVVIISGPAHICRQWLQRMDNQIQYRYRYFAIADSDTIKAQLYPASGTPKVYTDLDSLYSLQECVKLHRLL